MRVVKTRCSFTASTINQQRGHRVIRGEIGHELLDMGMRQNFFKLFGATTIDQPFQTTQLPSLLAYCLLWTAHLSWGQRGDLSLAAGLGDDGLVPFPFHLCSHRLHDGWARY